MLLMEHLVRPLTVCLPWISTHTPRTPGCLKLSVWHAKSINLTSLMQDKPSLSEHVCRYPGIFTSAGLVWIAQSAVLLAMHEVPSTECCPWAFKHHCSMFGGSPKHIAQIINTSINTVKFMCASTQSMRLLWADEMHSWLMWCCYNRIVTVEIISA